jgi:D-psicose/D-tagatose/L-ribulose 3-epimerase
MPELTLCNELLAADGLSLPEQCRVAAALGYMGLELAPGTLGSEPHRLPAAQVAEVRRTIEDHGLRITGLHWLLFPYPDLSITDPGRAGPATRDVLMALTDLCAALGGTLMVHGSPGSRVPPEGEARAGTLARVAELLAPIAAHAGAAGVTYCFEPLAREDTAFVNTIAEAVALVERVGDPALRTMIDTSAAGRAEAEPVAEVIRRWMPTGWLAHVHVNDTARGAPGTGRDPFPAIVRALRETGWNRPIGMEPFVTCIDATTTAAIGAATIRACWDAAA